MHQLSLQIVLNLMSENVSKDTTNNKHREHQQGDSCVHQQQTLHLLVGTVAAKERIGETKEASGDLKVSTGKEQTVSEETREERLRCKSPNADRDNK